MASSIDIDFGLNAKDFINGINAVETGIKKSTASVNRQIQSLAKEYKTLSGNIDNYERYKAVMRGADDAQRSQIQALLDKNNALRKEKAALAEAAHAAEQIMRVERKREESLNSLIGSIDKEHYAIGRSNTEIKLHEMKLLGASDAQLRFARGQLQAINATKKQALGLDLMSQKLTQIALGYAGMRGFTMLTSSMDEWTTLNNRIRLVTKSSAEFKIAQQGIVSISKNTGQALGSIGSTYQSIARAQNELGLSQREVLDLTETISKAMVVGGGTAEGNAAALVQLGQALSSGVLRGEEFNSIMEQAPGLAKALAEGLNVPVGSLRSMAEAGQLTSKVVTQALQKVSGSVNKDFKSMDLTISQSVQTLKTSFTEFVGQSSDATGAAKILSRTIRFAAENLDLLVIAAMGLAGAKLGLWLASATKSGIIWIANLVLQRKMALEAAVANELNAKAIASYVPAAATATGSVATLSGALGVLRGTAAATTVTMKGLGTVANTTLLPLLALTAAFDGLNAAAKFAQGKDAGGYFWQLANDLAGMDSEVESLGTKLAELVNDEKGYFSFKKTIEALSQKTPIIIAWKLTPQKFLYDKFTREEASIKMPSLGNSVGNKATELFSTSENAIKIAKEIEKSTAEFEKLRQNLGLSSEQIKINEMRTLAESLAREKNGKALQASAQKNIESAEAAYKAKLAFEENAKAQEEQKRKAEENAKFVTDEISKRETLIAQLGKTKEQITALELAAKGASSAQIKQVNAMESVIGEYEKQKSVMQTLDGYQKEVARLGLSDTESKLLDLKEAGATEQQLSLAKMQLGAIEEFKLSTQMNKNTASSFDKSMTLSDSMAEKFANGVDGFVGGVDKLKEGDKAKKSPLALDNPQIGLIKGKGWYNDHIDKDPTGRGIASKGSQQVMADMLKKAKADVNAMGKNFGTLYIASQDGKTKAEVQATPENIKLIEQIAMNKINQMVRDGAMSNS